MTAPNGPIKINGATGSDTQASGLGPSTAVFGTTGTSTSGSAVVSGISTTGVSAGDLFWGNTSSGRQFSIIASVDSASQVTLDDNLSANHAGNLTWAVGGKRDTLMGTSSVKLIDNNGSAGDAKGGWIIEMEDGHTESARASELALRCNGSDSLGRIEIRGASGAATLPVLTFSNNGNALVFAGTGIYLHDFELQNTNATKTASVGINASGTFTGSRAERITISHATNKFWRGYDSGARVSLIGCNIGHCAEIGVRCSGSTNFSLFTHNFVHDCGGRGMEFSGDVLGLVVAHNICTRNGSDGIAYTQADANNNRGATFIGNICQGNTGDGFEVSGANSNHVLLRIFGHIFAGNGGYGLNFSSGTATAAWLSHKGVHVDSNAFYNNTSGHRTTNVDSIDTNSVDATADPFVDAANDDFNINNDAGGGASLRAATVTMT